MARQLTLYDLVDQLQRKLNLPRVTRSLADLTESRAVDDVRRQLHVDNVEEIEELRAELQVDKLCSAPARAERRVFDHCEVIVVKGRPAERVAAERAETPLIRSGSSSNVNGDREIIRSVV